MIRFARMPDAMLVVVLSLADENDFVLPAFALLLTCPDARLVYGLALGDLYDDNLHEAFRDCLNRCNGELVADGDPLDALRARVLKACDADEVEAGPLADCRREVLALLEGDPDPASLEEALRAWADERNRRHAAPGQLAGGDGLAG